jgi:hypothetical protein
MVKAREADSAPVVFNGVNVGFAFWTAPPSDRIFGIAGATVQCRRIRPIWSKLSERYRRSGHVTLFGRTMLANVASGALIKIKALFQLLGGENASQHLELVD